MTDTYASFDKLIDDVVKAACYGDLWVNGWIHKPDGSVEYAAGGGLGGIEPRPVAGPGQGYPDDALAPSGTTSPSPGADGQLRPPSTTVGDVYRTWENAIPPVFEPFRGMPDPGEFQALADDVRKTLSQLSTEGHTGSGTSTGDQGSANIDYPANTTLGKVDTVTGQLNAWQGASAMSFSTYLGLFKEVVGNQALACEVLRITLLEEKEMWTRLRADAVTFAQNAKSAFGKVGNITVDDIKALLSVAGTINTVLGWFPALAPVSGPLGTATSVAGVLVDTLGGSHSGETNDLAARGPFDVLHNCESHRDKLTGYARTVEGDIQKSLTNLKAKIDAAPPQRSNGTTDDPSFRLDRPKGVYDATSTHDWVKVDMNVEWSNVNSAAAILDQEIAPEMTTAAGGLDAGDSAYQWYRAGNLGVGTYGAYSDYSAASYSLQKEISETAHEIDWAAEMLRAVARDLRGVDENIKSDFNQVRNQINGYDHPAPAVTVYPGGRGPNRAE